MTTPPIPAQRHAWIDASAGVAGDMLLGALVDAGAPLPAIQQAVDAVIPGSVLLTRSAVNRAGQRATKLDVAVLVDDPPHRTWRTIDAALAASALDAVVRDRAIAVFSRLAEAEGQVHGFPSADVHFHEVGALDSVADVVGVCAALAQLQIATISASEVAVGSGRLSAAHGDLPIPVPAVTQLAVGWQVRAGGRGELATPTGMALITALADNCEPLPPLQIDAVGVGAGSKDIDGRANVTRVVLGHRSSTNATGDAESMLLVEANIDDLDPRLWPGVLNQLIRTGAADAWLTPILMKKGRPAHTLAVLCRPDQAEAIHDSIFATTSTIGIREQPVCRRALARAWCDVPVADGRVAIKLAHREGIIVQATPEFDTISTVASRASRPPRDVLDEAIAAANSAGLINGAPLPSHARAALDAHSAGR